MQKQLALTGLSKYIRVRIAKLAASAGWSLKALARVPSASITELHRADGQLYIGLGYLDGKHLELYAIYGSKGIAMFVKTPLLKVTELVYSVDGKDLRK